MASSSTSLNHSKPRACEYDVFLSFRGEDTRKTFVDHLYSVLVDREIHTYRDDKTLPRGEVIGPSLFKGIEESRIAVIIFSKNYADSSWCLEELAYIMKCKDERGLIVMPVFYDVEASEVRKLKGNFGKAFSKHEHENVAKVESWRKALFDASEIAGWDPKTIANGHESEVIKLIAERILDILLSFNSDVDEHLVGVATRLHDLKSVLKVGSDGVRMVGIWGIGGSGKTTLASSLYKEISRQFQSHCNVDNIRVESSKPGGLKSLQEYILSRVLKAPVQVQSVEEGKELIKSRLCASSVLMFLDDVSDLDQLEALVGSHKWFGSGSRIVITTRDEHLLRTHKVDEVYFVELLSEGEAIRLFNRRAFKQENTREGFETLSSAAVSYAAGLPLALKVLGSFLFDKDKNEWESTLDKLKDFPDLKVMNILKTSYEGLETYQKELFLDIACFWRGWRIEDAMEVLESCNFYPRIGIKVLIQKALITIWYGVFDMHDLVEEMGHYIVRGEHPNNPEEHSRLWKQEDITIVCYTGETTENNKIEAIKYRILSPSHDHLSRLWKTVPNLKKLRWLNVHFIEPIEISHRFPGSSLPENSQPVEKIDSTVLLRRSTQQQISKDWRPLPLLKVLELKGMEELLCTPDFDGLPCLQKLELTSCRKLQEIHSSLGNHTSLRYVTVESCPELKRFPTIYNMKNLRTLTIWNCNKIIEFPNIHANLALPLLKVLKLRGMEELLSTPNFDGLPCLQNLELSNCPNLKEIHSSFGNHTSLENVTVGNCDGLERFPTIFNMENLKTLKIWNCKTIVEFPDIHANMENLVELSICSTRIEVLPSSIGKRCTNLVSLHVSWLWVDSLKSIQSNSNTFKHLKKLELIGLIKLKEPSRHSFHQSLDCIPSSMGELPKLEVLDLSYNDFSRVDPSLSQLTELKLLKLSHCNKLVELPKLPSNLAILKADSCQSLATIGDSSKNCDRLCHVSLYRGSIKNDGGRLLQYMLEGKHVENGCMILVLGNLDIPKGFTPSLTRGKKCRLQLEENWCNDFSGFLICGVFDNESSLSCLRVSMSEAKRRIRFFSQDENLETGGHVSFLRKRMREAERRIDSQYDVIWEGGDDDDDKRHTWVGYVPFSLLRECEWWDQEHKAITVTVGDEGFIGEHMCSGFGVRLVPKTSRSSGLTETSTYSPSDYTPDFKIEEDAKWCLTISLAGT